MEPKYVSNLKGRIRALILSSVRNPLIIRLEKISDPVKSEFADYMDLMGKPMLLRGDHLFIPFSGSGIIKFENGDEYGIDAEHRDIEVYSQSDGFKIRLSNSIRFGRLGQFDQKFMVIKYRVDQEMLDLYYRLKTVVEVLEEFRQPEHFKNIEEIIEGLPELKISLLSYIVHSEEFRNSYEMDDLLRKMNELPEGNASTIDHSKLFTAKKNLSDIEKIIRAEFFSNMKTKLVPIGHSHIDLAWLWPISETIEKAHRSFATMTYLMKERDFLFVQSMAWHYRFIEENFPELFDDIVKYVKSGKWIPIGGMMVEPDCNLPSGESLVRQVLYGQRYFNEHFGKRSNISWLPDTFGFPAQLPQILSKSGFDLFVTTKLSWNDTNRFPYDTFVWKSPDGSSIIAHSHTRTYNSKTDFGSLMKTVKENSISSEKAGVVPIIYGYGDGGGGPNMKMLDEIKSLQNLSNIFIRDDNPLDIWTSRLKSVYESLPSFNGELYLEYHRGTYTTHGDIKMHNRLAEGKLLKAEALYSILDQNSSERSFRNEWEKLLKNQFHDILPGSSIMQVYRDSIHELEQLEIELDGAMREKMDQYRSDDNSFTVFCPYSFETEAWISLGSNKVPGKVVASPDRKILPVIFNGKDYGFYAYFNRGLGLYTYSFFQKDLGKTAQSHSLKKEEEKAWNVEWNRRGITKIERKGVVFPVPALMLFNDFPGDFDAWELDHHTLSNGINLVPENVRVKEIDEFGKTLEAEYSLNPGSMLVKYEFPEYEDYVNLDFTVDWKGNNRLLKMYVPVEGSSLIGEQPYLVDEPPRGEAAFEFPMHRIVGVVQNEKIFVLMNRTKYGHSFESGNLGVTLLRSPAYPDPFADRGKNLFSFRYGFMDGFSQNCMVNEGMKFNILPEVFHGHKADSSSFIRINGAVFGSIKKAEHSGNRVLRIVNLDRHDNKFEISVPWKCRKVIETDLLEQPVDNRYRNLSFEDFRITGNIRANEIVTLNIEM